MKDIHHASSKFHAILFADDTNLTSTLCSFDVNIDNNCSCLQLSTNINKEGWQLHKTYVCNLSLCWMRMLPWMKPEVTFLKDSPLCDKPAPVIEIVRITVVNYIFVPSM